MDVSSDPEQTSPKIRMRLLMMGATYALGTFNDNFFKQAACLLALSIGLKEIQGHAGIIFALPFVLFSAWAGWLADRLPKSSIVVWAKGLELLAMCKGCPSGQQTLKDFIEKTLREKVEPDLIVEEAS